MIGIIISVKYIWLTFSKRNRELGAIHLEAWSFLSYKSVILSLCNRHLTITNQSVSKLKNYFQTINQ